MLLHRLAVIGRSRPTAVSLVTATTKTVAADVVTQRYLEGRTEIDVRRTGLFTAFGFWYLGGFQYWLYAHIFIRWFPAAARFGEHATLAARLRDRDGLKALACQTFWVTSCTSRSSSFQPFISHRRSCSAGARPRPQRRCAGTQRIVPTIFIQRG
jgi:hypothetical protein